MRPYLIVLLILFLLILLLGGCVSQAVPPTPMILIITPAATSLRPAAEGQMYVQSFTATGGTAPYTWSVISGSLPKGMSITSAGVIYGTPTELGSFSFTIQVIDSAASSAQIQIKGKLNETS